MAMSNEEFFQYLQVWDAILVRSDTLSEADLTLHTIPCTMTGKLWPGLLYILVHGKDQWELTREQAQAWSAWNTQKMQEQSNRRWLKFLLGLEKGEQEEEREASHAYRY